MPVVIARLAPKLERRQDVLDLYTETIPQIHAEPGCELFALHTDGNEFFIVEHWATEEDFQAHVRGPVLATIRKVLAEALAKPSEINRVDSIPLGEATKGVLRPTGGE
jgi:quinol monooxygenase YgiN